MSSICYNIHSFVNNIIMKNFIKNLALFISAFIPLYFLIIVKILIEIINQNLSFNVLNTTMLIFSILLITVGIFGVILSINFDTSPSKEITIVSKKNITDQHFLGYFSLFVLFAITFELERVSMSIIFVAVLSLIGIVYIKNKLYYINPFLNIIGYSFYEIEYKENGSDEVKIGKIFFKGELNIKEQTHFVKFRNENFSFLDTKK